MLPKPPHKNHPDYSYSDRKRRQHLRPSYDDSPRPLSPITVALIIIAALLVAAGCGSTGSDIAGDVSTALEEAAGEIGGSSRPSGEAATVTVTQVTDGDTVEIDPAIMGHTEVRLVGIDAPEDTSETDPLGPQATAFAEKRLEGERVEVMVAQDAIGPYERLLANISRDGSLFSERLLSRGLAQTLFIEPNTRFKAEFEAIQSQAREANKGIWGLPPSKQCELADRGNGLGGC